MTAQNSSAGTQRFIKAEWNVLHWVQLVG